LDNNTPWLKLSAEHDTFRKKEQTVEQKEDTKKTDVKAARPNDSQAESGLTSIPSKSHDTDPKPARDE
jgi:hypothetical protein